MSRPGLQKYLPQDDTPILFGVFNGRYVAIKGDKVYQASPGDTAWVESPELKPEDVLGAGDPQPDHVIGI